MHKEMTSFCCFVVVICKASLGALKGNIKIYVVVIIIVCLTFLSLLRLSKKPGDNKAKKSKQVSQKYTAARLHEKGVLIAIEDLQPNQ